MYPFGGHSTERMIFSIENDSVARTWCRRAISDGRLQQDDLLVATVLGALAAAHVDGAIALAEGDAQAALGPLRNVFEAWQQIEAPYLAARVRVQVGRQPRAQE